jgi:flagellar biosynthesis/type III secretory pathway chaperone
MPKPQQAAHATPRAAIVAFIALLEREQRLLAQPQADALEALSVEKQRLLAQIDTLYRGASAAGARAAPPDATTRVLAAQAQQLNAINARLLALHRNACESRLRVLRSNTAGTLLYSASGYLGG